MATRTKKSAPEQAVERTAKTSDIGGTTPEGICVNSTMTLSEFSSAVEDIVDICFPMGENGTKNYAPYLYHFAFRYCVLVHCTDLGMPDEIEDIWNLVEYSGEYEKVEKLIDARVLSRLDSSASMLIRHEANKLENSGKIDALLEGVSALLSELAESMKGVDLAALVGDIKKQLPNLQEVVTNAVLNKRTGGSKPSTGKKTDTK